jgi:hypothetical protein
MQDLAVNAGGLARCRLHRFCCPFRRLVAAKVSGPLLRAAMRKTTHTMKTNAPRTLLAAALLAWLAATPAQGQLSVEWIRQYGTSSLDIGSAITVDASGQSWVSGYTTGDLGATGAGSGDIFLSRLSASGTVDFTQQRGGNGADISYGVALVGSSTVFVGGDTLSAPFDGAALLGSAGVTDALTVRYDTSGVWQGTRRIGGGNVDTVAALTGNATHLLAAGSTMSAFEGQSTSWNNTGAFLSKRNSTGDVIWTRFLETNAPDQGRAAAFDSAGNAYLAGGTQGSLSGFTNAGSNDLFVARYNGLNGSRTLLQQFGTSGLDLAYDMAVDLGGNIYLTGSTEGALGGQTNAGLTDAFVMKLDSNGSVLWTRLLGGSAAEESLGLGLDAAGNVWIGGHSYSTFGGHANVGSADAFVAAYDSAGNLFGTTFFGTPGIDTINGLAIGSDGAAYVTGYTTGALSPSNGVGHDVFVSKITAVPEPSTALLGLSGVVFTLVRRRRH